MAGNDLYIAGIIIMGVAGLLLLIQGIVFTIVGMKLKEKLRKEYGEPWKYNL